jgi:DNA polymerase-3 subunit epsilon/CBS domain-containing protein
LSVDIFFDLRGVHGDVAMAEALWREGFAAARGQASFAKLLTEASGLVEPGRSWFGGFRTEQGRIDLKKSGLFGVVGTARALAIRHHVTERATPARLAGIKALGLGLARDLDALIEAQEVFLDLILRQQIVDIETGVPPSNRVEVRRLSQRERERLAAAFRSVEHLQDIARDLLFGG